MAKNFGDEKSRYYRLANQVKFLNVSPIPKNGVVTRVDIAEPNWHSRPPKGPSKDEFPDFQPRFKTMADNLVRIDNILLFNKKPLYHMIMMKDLPELLKIFDFDIKKTAAYMNWHEGRLSALC